jgi:hypothetical protein
MQRLGYGKSFGWKFESSQPHHVVLRKQEISQISANSPEPAGIRAPICLCNPPIGFPGPFRGLCLCLAKSRFPTAETGVGGDPIRMLGQWGEKPSISRCLDSVVF